MKIGNWRKRTESKDWIIWVNTTTYNQLNIRRMVKGWAVNINAQRVGPMFKTREQAEKYAIRIMKSRR